MRLKDSFLDLGPALASALEMTVLVRQSPMNYVLYGEAPLFYSSFFPCEADGGPCLSPWKHSLMLDSFIADSEAFFESNETNAISTGYWLEEPEDDDDRAEGLPLMAWARKLDGLHIITIQRICEEYAERGRILRQARNILLERRIMSADLAAFRKKALYDPLTQVYNRNGFADFLERLTAKSNPSVPGIALVMLDVDNFKAINDELGHIAGDQVLSHLGKILRESLRSQDTPVRFGGEEFIVLAPNATLAQAFILGEKLRGLIDTHDFEIGRHVTVSVGGTLYDINENVNDFIDRADRALYNAKRNGKNIVCIRDPVTREHLFAADFEKAIRLNA